MSAFRGIYSYKKDIFLRYTHHILGPPKPKDDWGGNGAPGGGSNWGDPMGRGGPVQRDADLNVRNDGRGVGSGWGGPSGGPQGPGQQRQQPGGGGSWGAPPPSTGGGGGRAPGIVTTSNHFVLILHVK